MRVNLSQGVVEVKGKASLVGRNWGLIKEGNGFPQFWRQDSQVGEVPQSWDISGIFLGLCNSFPKQVYALGSDRGA